MFFQLLGTFRVQRDGCRVDLGGLRQQRLLAMLLLEANRVVTADRLIDAMWEDTPPVTARRQLYNAVAVIRRSFESAKSIIVKDGPGYRIQIDPLAIDAHRFTTMVARAAGSAAEGRTAEAIELLKDGLALWEGPALSGLNSPVLDVTAVRLEEKRLSATEQLLGLRLSSGHAAEVVPQLGELVSRHPLREETRRLLILALHESGRKAEALNVYEQGRRLLSDEMGVDPSMALRQLYERILRDDVPQADDGEPAREATVSRSFLPYDTAHFTGRVNELRMLSAARPATGTALDIVAIDGMAGIGKTTLAVRLAHQLAHGYPDGHLYIDLHGHTPGRQPLEADAALERLMRDFGLPPTQIPSDSCERAARWRAEVAERRILVVLDNALDVKQIRPLLPGTGKALVIITSRRRLVGLDGITSCSLDVFSPADAAELFTRIAGVQRTQNRHEAVDEIAALCGHLPLAVGIAASRFHNRPAWSLDHLTFRLRDERGRLSELSFGDRSLAASFEMSYQNLPTQSRHLMSVLGFCIHPGEEFDAGTAAALMNIPVLDADRLLEDLFDAHLLQQSTAGRYHFHELVREYAATKAATELDSGGGTAFMPSGDVCLQAGA